MKHQQFVIHWLAFIFISLNLSLPAQSFHISSDLKTTWSTNQNEGVNTINKENIPLPKKDETSLISSQSNYRIPRAAESVTVADIDLDGDNDIVVGHKTAWQATNPTITFLENINNGVLNILDTSNVFCGYQEHIIAADFNNDNFADIVAFMGDLSSGIIERYVRIFYNYNGEFELFQEFPLNTDEVFSDIYWGDINGDYSNDIIVASGNGQIWGVLYNDGYGALLQPEYQYVTDYFPNSITCGDLNNDNRDDIVVCGQSTEVYFSYPDGFQSQVLEIDDYKQGSSIIDFDQDGDNDILTSVGIPFVDITSLIIYENQGNNTFIRHEEFYFQPSSYRFSVTDFNNDSLADILFLLSDHSGYIIYYNQGNFQLADSLFVALPPSDPEEARRNCYCADIDGNGYNDIITVKTLNVPLCDNLSILFNDGNGNFVENPVTGISQIENTSLQNLICYPNPFTTETTFEFIINEPVQAELSVYNLQGQLTKCIINNIQKGGQNNKIKWDGLDTGGKPCKPGPYFALLKINGEVRESFKLIKINTSWH